MKEILKILKFAKPFKKTLIIISIMIVIVSLAKQFNPWITKNITDIVQATIEGELTTDEAINNSIPILAALLIATWINWLANRISWHNSGILKEKLRNSLRKKGFNHLLKQDIGYFDNQTSGSIMSKVDRGINRITSQITEVTGFFLPNILTALIAIVLIIQVKWEFVAILLVGFIPFIIINTIALKKYEPIEKEWNKLYDDEYGHFYEVISSIRLVKSFDKTFEELERLEEFNSKVDDYSRRAEKVWDFSSIKDFILDTWVWGLILYLVISTITGSITLGTFFLLFQYTYILREPLWNLTWMYFEFRRMAIGSKAFLKVMNRKSKIKQKKNAKELKNIEGNIKFKDVRFSYKKGKEVIKGMNFEIDAGETIALVARSGGGKTTVANLINRFYDVDSGEILIDNNNIKNLNLRSLHQKIGVVLQDAYLYDDTIRMNLKYGKLDATDEEMIKACKLANAWEFIENLKKGLDTKIGERGIQLSGGQKQRLSIARTILKNPSILILDEATSALDSESELKVQEAIWNLIQNRTTIIIAHRLSTILRADRIFVLEDGVVKESGNHKELVQKKNGIYAKLYEMQTSADRDKFLVEYELN